MASRNRFWSSHKEAKNSGPVEKPRRRRRPLGFMPLEPRIMYDGAAAATAAHHHPDITAVVGHPSNGGTVELQGTGKAGATVNVYADGGTTIVGSGKVGSDGTFDITTSATFADGVHALTAKETFGGKWTSDASTAFAVNVDPNAPVITAVVGQPLNGGTAELKGAGEAGETVNLYADGGTTIVGTGMVGSDGTFDIKTNATFTDGIHTFTATEINGANLTSAASTAFAVNVDPNAAVITEAVGQPVNGGTAELKGTGEAGETVNLYADGGTNIVGTGTVGSDGSFDITTTATFSDGVHTFTATEINSANLTGAASAAFAVNVAPNAPVITALVGQPVNGGTVELQGTGEAGESVNLYVDGGNTIVGTGRVGAGGVFDITTTATFPDGVHAFTATETRSANLTGAASTAFSVDVDPNAPVITALVGQQSNGTVELRGSGVAGATVNLYADGGTTIVGTGTVGSDGIFDITTTTALSDGLHTFTATATDSCDLTSAASTAFDPSAPVITALVGQPTNGGTVELQGTGEAGATINLYADGGTTIVGSGTVGLGGTFDITTTVALPDGVHTFTATATDGANRTSAALTAFAVTIDPNAPVITAVGQPSNGGAVELQGTGEAGATINLYADGGTTIVGTGTVGSNGTFDITTTATFAGSGHTFTATATDGANLTSTASAPAASAPSNSVDKVVFIDGQVPDLQDLINGVTPGEQVFVLNASQDGLQQIAAILADNGLDNLSAISIVGHGLQGEFTIGATDLTDASLASEASTLAAIGQSLKPGGDILLYGCDVAQGAAGQQFIADLSAYAGGANVAASTQNIGTLQGTNGGFENWTLDASTGPIDASVPFTAAALASYEGLLTNTTLTASSITTTLTVDADHDGGMSPGDTVTSTVTITNTTSTDASGVTLDETATGLTPGSVVITPIAVNDTYTLTGNTPLTVNAADGVLANDIDFNGDALTALSATNVVGGSVTLNSDGSFTFTPTTGFAGTASFQYSAHDAAGNSDTVGTVKLTVTAPVWYVDSANTGSQDGSFAHPFTTIQAAVSAAAADTAGGDGVNNTIFVENAGAAYSGSPITLASGEQLLGDGSSLTQVNGNSVGLSTVDPTLSVSSASAAVTLGSNNTISGINIANTSTGDGIENSGNIGTFTMSNVGVSTKSGTGIALTSGGTVDAIGSGNTINASTGTALDVENTTIGTGNLIFKSISSGTGGSAANDGIVLVNTGSSGGLIVTGDGSTAFGGDGSGGTITGKTGADGSTTGGIGIYLNNTADVSLDDMTLSSFGNFAIRGFGVTNFAFQNSTISGQSGQNLTSGGKPTYEGTIAFGSDGSQSGGAVQNGLTGAATISNSNIGFGLTDVLYIYDNSGTLNRLTLTGNTFGGIDDQQNAFGANEVYIQATNGSSIDATVTGNIFTSSAGDGFFADVRASASMDLVFDDNTVGNSATLPLQGSDSVELSDASTGTVTYDISNDTITNAVSAGILAVLTGSGTKMSGTINDDTIGSSNATAAGSGSQFDGIDVKIEGGSGTSTTAITNNSIYHFGEDGINLLADNGSSTLNATVTGNKIMDPDGSFPFAGVELDSGALNSDGNNINMTLGSATNGLLQNTFTFNGTLENTDGYTPVFLQTLGTSKIAVAQAGSGSNTADGVVENDNIFTPLSNSAEVADSQAGGPISETSTTPTTPTSLGLSPTLTQPFISGTPEEGLALTATAAVGDSHTSSIGYQWQENFGEGYVNITGATGTSYTPTEADVGANLRLVATSMDSSGVGTESISSPTALVQDHLTFTSMPVISGTAAVGQILTATAATTDNSDATITYQWEKNSGSGFAAIAGATGLNYRPVAADAGDTLELIATATDPHGGNISTTVVDSTQVAAFTAQTLSNVSIGTLPGNDKVTLTWTATVNAQSNGLITTPTYSGSITGSNLSPSSVSVVPAANSLNLDTLTLGGEIFDDVNGNGLLDGGESGISGVSVSVFAQDNTNSVLETVLTNGSGDFSFTGLAAGSYVVQVNASNFQSGGALANFSNSSAVSFDPNNYVAGQNAGNPKSAGVVDARPITIAYDQPYPPGATTFPGDDTTNTLDIGFVSGPAIGGSGTTVGYYENGAAQAVDTGLTITDPTNANITSATISITDAGSFVPGDLLAFTPQFGITGTYNTSTGVLMLSGSATATQYQSVLDSLTYSFAGDPTVGGTPPVSGTEHVRTVSYQVTDVTNLTSAAVTSTVDTFAPPTISLGAATVATFIQGGGSPVTLDPTISFTDPNALTTLSSATVALGAGFVTGLDTLSVASSLTGTGITATYDPNSGVLTLSGTSNAGNYATALENVQFTTTSTSLAGRSVTWTVNDDAGGHSDPSATATSTIAVVHADSAPVLSHLGNSLTTSEPPAPVLDSVVTVSDAELGALNSGSGDYSGASLTIARQGGANAQDAFAFSTSGATFTVSGNELQSGGNTFATFSSVGGTLQISFTSSATAATTALVNNVLEHVTYTNLSASTASGTLDWTFNDGNSNGAQGVGGAKTATGSTTIDITTNQPPVVSVPGTQLDGENVALTFSNTISIADPSIAGNDTVTLTVLDGTLSVGPGAVAGSFANNNTTSVTLTGTLADINADLNGLTYTPNSNFTGTDTLNVTATDPGTTLSGSAAVTINVGGSSITATQTTTTDADGDVAPGDNVTTTVVITNTGGSDASGTSFNETQNGLTQTGTVEATPIAVNDSYTLTGNTPVTIDAAHGVLANDTDASDATGASLTAINATNVVGGNLTLNADGSFTFTPTTGFAGTASFHYTAHDTNDNLNSDVTGTVTLTVTAPVWYVNGAAASGGDGSSANPFQTVDAAVAAAANDVNAGSFSRGVNNTILVENGSATYFELNPITLANGEQLLGSGDPTISVDSSSAAILLASNNTISGINIVNTGTGDGIDDASGGVGTLTMSAIGVSTTQGTGISLTHGGTVDITGSGNTINSTAGTALDVANTTIGSGNLNFQSISAGNSTTASTTDGIILDTTGSSGGLIVTGQGTHGRVRRHDPGHDRRRRQQHRRHRHLPPQHGGRLARRHAAQRFQQLRYPGQQRYQLRVRPLDHQCNRPQWHDAHRGGCQLHQPLGQRGHHQFKHRSRLRLRAEHRQHQRNPEPADDRQHHVRRRRRCGGGRQRRQRGPDHRRWDRDHRCDRHQ